MLVALPVVVTWPSSPGRRRRSCTCPRWLHRWPVPGMVDLWQELVSHLQGGLTIAGREFIWWIWWVRRFPDIPRKQVAFQIKTGKTFFCGPGNHGSHGTSQLVARSAWRINLWKPPRRCQFPWCRSGWPSVTDSRGDREGTYRRLGDLGWGDIPSGNGL